MKKYINELNIFLESSVGEITFERKPNGDIIIIKRETILIKNNK